jgi:hypothetical protein
MIECNTWSWKAVYSKFDVGPNDPCPQNNNVAFGANLIIQSIIDAGYEVPQDMTIEFNLYEIE